MVLTVSSLFRTVAAASRSLVEAIAPAAVIILVLVSITNHPLYILHVI